MDSIDLRVIESSIREIEATLKHCIISNNICRVDDSISWSNYQKGIIKNTYYPIEYQSNIDRRQYSLLFSDLSAIQFYYNFDRNGKLNAARLALYPNPDLTLPVDNLNEFQDFQYRDLMCDHMFSIMDILSDIDARECLFPTNTSHIRFDYDGATDAHSKSHFQISGINDFRIDTNFILLPKTFLLLCNNLMNISGLDSLANLSEEPHFSEFNDSKREKWHFRYLRNP